MGSGRFFESQDDGICILDIRRELKKLGWKLTSECGWWHESLEQSKYGRPLRQAPKRMPIQPQVPRHAIVNARPQQLALER